MLLNPKNPCESLCKKLFLNIDDTEWSSKFFVCDTCNKFTTFQNLDCTCGKPTNKQPNNLDSEGLGNSGGIADALNGVFVKDNGSLFLVYDDLKIVPSSLVSSMQMLMELGYSDLSQLEEVTHNIGKQEVLVLCFTMCIFMSCYSVAPTLMIEGVSRCQTRDVSDMTLMIALNYVIFLEFYWRRHVSVVSGVSVRVS